MHSADVSPVRRGEGSDAILSRGDEGEQLIANVLVAAMVSQLCSEAAARWYVDHAYALAKDLARRTVTYRPLQLSKFARLSFEVEGQIETFLVSIVNDALVVPTFSSEKLKANLLRTRGPIKFVDIELVRFMLRLRTRRIVAALEPLQTTISQGALFRAVEYLLTECLRHEVRSEEALDRASDCFILAHDLVGKKNYSIASFVLNNAVRALDSYLSSTQVGDHRAVVNSMKGKIAQLLEEIKRTAA
jgi:hypothetical protein